MVTYFLVWIISYRYFFYERTSNYLKKIQNQIKLFHEWKEKKLTTWQYDALIKIMQQRPRDIIWFVDERGNVGKTFLATFLTILYKFQYLTGQVLNVLSRTVAWTNARQFLITIDCTHFYRLIVGIFRAFLEKMPKASSWTWRGKATVLSSTSHWRL